MTRLNVLIADDDDSIVKTLCMTVKALGHRAAGAGSGEQALRELERGEFDFLLTDLRMEGMSGVELVSEARRIRPELPQSGRERGIICPSPLTRSSLSIFWIKFPRSLV